MGRGRLRRTPRHGARRAEAVLTEIEPVLAPRTRRAVTLWSALAYLGAWCLGLALAALGAAMVEDRGNWEDLGAAILGFLGGALAGHIVWAVLVVRLLRPFDRPSRTVAVIVLSPILVILAAGGLAGMLPFSIVPLCGIPAALTWWAAEPEASSA